MAADKTLDGSKILLVDDTPQNLKILRAALQPEGYVLLVATNGEGAIRIAGSALPDLILLYILPCYRLLLRSSLKMK